MTELYLARYYLIKRTLPTKNTSSQQVDYSIKIKVAEKLKLASV